MDDKQHYQKKFERMRQQHELDKQALMARFQQQSSSFHQHHQLQLQEHLKKVLSQHREQQIMDQLKATHHSEDLLNSIKNKEKKQESAVASNAVKKHLKNFVMGRQNMKMDHYSNHPMNRIGAFRWNPLIDGIDDGHEGTANSSPAYRGAGGDFPLRKTASEPNLKVPSRLKQKLSNDQRSSPLLPRHDTTKDVKANLANRIKKKINAENAADLKNRSPGNHATSTSSPPPNAHNDTRLSMSHTEADFYEKKKMAVGNFTTCDLYSSPSLPNISLGMPKKSTELATFPPNNAEINLVSRTASLPGPLPKLSSKPDFASVPEIVNDKQFDSAHFSDNVPQLPMKHISAYEAGSLPSSHGPIRPSQMTRPHKALIRTQSAPSSASSQLQQHIMKRNKTLRQQYDQKMMLKHGLSSSHERHQPNLSAHYQSELESKDFYNRLSKNFPLGIYSAINKETLSYQDHVALYHLSKKFSQPMMVDASASPVQQTDTVMVSEADPKTKSPVQPNSSVQSPRNILRPSIHKPLQRAQSSPAVSLMKKLSPCKKYRHTTGISYSPVMLRHGCACGDDHIEHAGRLEAIWNRLRDCGLVKQAENNGPSVCELVEPRKATTDELQLVHTQEHTLRYGTTSLARKELDLCSKFIVLPCGGVGVDNGIDVDTVWNELETINAARMAVGCTVDLALAVAQNQLKNGFALVRPPGHHAQKDLAMAFCYFNSVAVATRRLQQSGCAEKILIVDWDIHHCNGTQNIFYDDPTVLVISVHRYDDGNFFPGTGAIDEVGSDSGVGFNINIGFSGGIEPPFGDPEYLAVFRTLLMPIAEQFSPDVVLVSSGFSAAVGHSPALGGYAVSPQCFGYLTQLLTQLANGKVVMVLEGGFEIEALCDCTEACLRTLLGENKYSKLSDMALTAKPHSHAVETIATVVGIQAKHWKELDVSLAAMSHAEWISVSRENEACDRLASLSVKSKIHGQATLSLLNAPSVNPETSRSRLQPSPTPMEECSPQTNSKPTNSFSMAERSPTEASISSENSPLDVVGTSAPSSPSVDRHDPTEDDNGERFVRNDVAT